MGEAAHLFILTATFSLQPTPQAKILLTYHLLIFFSCNMVLKKKQFCRNDKIDVGVEEGWGISEITVCLCVGLFDQPLNYVSYGGCTLMSVVV